MSGPERHVAMGKGRTKGWQAGARAPAKHPCKIF